MLELEKVEKMLFGLECLFAIMVYREYLVLE